MARNIINKLLITAEAKLDYDGLIGGELPQLEIKREIEEYIDFFIGSKSDAYYKYYFRAKYYIEEIGKMTIMFIYKDKTIRNMQIWRLAGICLEEDWNIELEESGQVRFWLSSKVENLGNEIDWVDKYRLWKEEQEKIIEEEEKRNGCKRKFKKL